MEDEAIQKWLTFFEDPYGREIKEMSEENEEIKVALEALEEINADDEKVRMAELREKYILDRNTEIRNAEVKGMQKGINLGKTEVAKKMKQSRMDIKIIMELTGLSKEEIENL